MQSMVYRSPERRPTPEKAAPLLRQALGDHRRDAVAHRHTVEGVRDLHRALLVGNDDQLRVSYSSLKIASRRVRFMSSRAASTWTPILRLDPYGTQEITRMICKQVKSKNKSASIVTHDRPILP